MSALKPKQSLSASSSLYAVSILPARSLPLPLDRPERPRRSQLRRALRPAPQSKSFISGELLPRRSCHIVPFPPRD